MKKKKLRLKRSIVSMLKVILGLLLLIISIYFLVVGSNYDIRKEKVIAYTSETNNIDYQVYLKENPYFTVPYLPKGEHYITSLIDHIHINYQHNFDITQPFSGTYHYRVIGTLFATEKRDNRIQRKIWDKQYMINPEKELIITDSKSLKLSDSFDIDYQYYRNLAEEFKNEYTSLANVSFQIKVYLDMDGILSKEKKAIANTTVLEMNIPLEDETIDIDTVYDKTGNRQIIKENNTKLVKNTPIFIAGCFTFAASVVVVASYLVELIINSKKQFSFSKEKNKILNKYDDDIVNASKVPNITGKNIIEVASFHELMDAKKALKVPIIYIEVIPGIVGWFIIIKENQVWRYQLEGKSKIEKK